MVQGPTYMYVTYLCILWLLNQFLIQTQKKHLTLTQGHMSEFMTAQILINYIALRPKKSTQKLMILQKLPVTTPTESSTKLDWLRRDAGDWLWRTSYGS